MSTHKQNNYFPPGPLPSSARWVIRTGMPAGNGGLELASGDSQITPAATGRSASSGSVTLTEYKIQIDGLPLSLPLGHYWLAVSPNVAFVASQTSGANCVGTPCGNSGSAFVQALATGVNAVATGLFFGGAGTMVSSTGTAAFVKQDSTTQGSWRGVYGADGYVVIGDLTSRPSYVTPVASGEGQAVWPNSLTDIRALRKASNPAERIAGVWYTDTLRLGLSEQVDRYRVCRSLGHSVIYCMVTK